MTDPASPPPPVAADDLARVRWIGLFAGLGVFVLMLVLPAPEGLSPEGWRTAAIAVLMAVWWMTEALPIPATALAPLALFPVFGVGSIRDAAEPYAHPLIWLFLGGFMIALAMQRWGLHRRIALNIIRAIGVRPNSIIFGFMVSSAFLSLWISNTAATLMLLPVALSVIELVGREPTDDAGLVGRNFVLVLMLGLAYAANVGGLGTLIGTPTNGVVVGYMEEVYGIEITFTQWLVMGLPFVVVTLPVMFWALTRWIYPVRLPELPGGRELIEAGLRDLGRMSRPELLVAVVFTATAVLWTIRPLLAQALPGLNDSSIAIFSALVLFALPADRAAGTYVLNWDWAKRLPWGVLILFGGGLSLAAAISRSGLADWIGGQLTVLGNWPVVLVLMLAIALIIFLTELTSNSATASAFLPILAAVAVGVMSENPILFLVPATFAASCAFMLPVATPPNAIVYSSERVNIRQMARAGLYLNFLFVVLLTLAAYVLIGPILGVESGVVPDWARPG